MEAFLLSTGIVALAEMGDKTQLLSLVLAARFKRPWPIVAGIFLAYCLFGEYLPRPFDHRGYDLSQVRRVPQSGKAE